MRARWKLLLASTALGLASALMLIVLAFLVSMLSRELAQWVWVPGEMLVRASNWLCPPAGAECVLGSARPGARHLWSLICMMAAWGLVFSAGWWWGLRRAARPGADHPQQGIS